MKFNPDLHMVRTHYEQQEIELLELKRKLSSRMVEAERGHYAVMKENIRLKAKIAALKAKGDKS